MKRIYVFLLLALLVLTGCGPQEEGSGSRVLHIYNWGDYVDYETIENFEEETGIKVIYDTFASNEDMYVKVKSGQDPYDVLVPSEYMIERMIREEMLQPLNFDLIPNFSKISPELLDKDYDPGNVYSVPYYWGTLGIVVNEKLVDEPITSWKSLWDSKYKNEIIMYNSQRDSIAVALSMLGYSMNSHSEDELMEAKEALVAQKPLVYAYLADEGRDVMSQGDAALSVMYSGDAAMMMEENEDLSYVIPEEGTNLWYDSFVIPKNAQNPEDAMRFINYMSRPDVAAINAEYNVGYSSPIPEAVALLPEELREDPVAYPDLNTLPPLEVYRDLGPYVEIYDRIWTEVTAR
ncbi:MAG: ABC transporter substrate-binding protein [Tissierellia bacterium]|nr:ABC transporter substrate-binding protein [Tissierellia bacterium]